MRRVATIMAGAVLGFSLLAPAVAGAASSEPGHYDRQHHDQAGENNCTKYRDQCQYDPRCDCYYRASQPPKSEPH